MENDLANSIKNADRIDTEISILLHDLQFINTDRRRLSGGAFMVSLDLHTAIIGLIRSGNMPAAFILCRSIWEATVRGYWLLECASNEEVQKFMSDSLSKRTWNMIKDLEGEGSFENETLSKIHSHNSKRLNGLNHVGGPLVTRCISARGVEHSFGSNEIIECLRFASQLALLSAQGIAQNAVDGELVIKLLHLQKKHWQN